MTENKSNLKSLAREGAAKAYAPYSNFRVGAALRTRSGETFIGCNIENASYGLTVCAERNAIAGAVIAGFGPGDIEEMAVFVDQADIASPCGACRQVISEFLSKHQTLTAYNGQGDSKTWTVAELLPDGFSLRD